MNNNDLLGRIHDLEAVVNGLMIYIAAKEAGVTLDPKSEDGRRFIKSNVARSYETRKAMYEDGSRDLAADGYHDSGPLQRIPDLVEKLRAEFGS